MFTIADSEVRSGFANKLDEFIFGNKENYRVATFDEEKYVKFYNGKLTCHDGPNMLEIDYFDPTGMTDEQIFNRVDAMIPAKMKE